MRSARTFFAALTLCACVRVAPGAASFQALGYLPTNSAASQAWAVSADGTTVAGICKFSGIDYAFRWTAADGMQPLGNLSGNPPSVVPSGVSGEGSVIVGSAGSVLDGNQPFRWTSATGMLPLNNFGGPTAGRARSISADGTVVVGDQRSGSMDLPYRWTLAGGTTPLSLPIGSTSGSAYGLSGDGQISVGATSQGTISRVTKWTSSGASVPLGSLSGSTSGIAHDASHAGNVIVGAVADQAVRWTSDNAAHGLGFFPGGTRVSLAEAVSSDGQVVVGYSDSVMGFQAFVWHPSTGMHNLRSILTDAGLNLTGWTLRSATDISADGTTIVGYADNPSGKQEACIATIPAIPEPVALFPAIGTLFLLVHRRVNVSKSRVASARTRGAVGGRRNVTQSSGRFTPVF